MSAQQDPTWHSDQGDLVIKRPPPLGWLLVIIRALALFMMLAISVFIYGVARLIERPFLGQNRPVSAIIAKLFCRSAVYICGVQYKIIGQPMAHPGAVVANHVSWLDIFALYGAQKIYFVSKAEVRHWPLIGPLAAMVGTVFIRRTRKDAQAQSKLLEDRFHLGHKLLFFPEGTSTDGRRVIPFKTTLFASFTRGEAHNIAWVQPVSLLYQSPAGADPRFYGWFGKTGFGAHVSMVLSRWRQGAITVQFHEPVPAADFSHRRDLARHCEATIQSSLGQAHLLENQRTDGAAP